MCSLKSDSVLFEVNYRSPYGCSHQVIVQENGEGIIVVGGEKNYNDKVLDFNQIIKKEKFEVDKKDLNFFEFLVSNISVPQIKGPVNDGFRYTLINNEKKIIDVYGMPPEVISEMSNILSKYYSFKIDYFCEEYLEIND